METPKPQQKSGETWLRVLSLNGPDMQVPSRTQLSSQQMDARNHQCQRDAMISASWDLQLQPLTSGMGRLSTTHLQACSKGRVNRTLT